jgi:hypothetical protein
MLPITSSDPINSGSLQGRLHVTFPDPLKNYYLDRNFIEWFVGFVDAEGNFNIKITGLNDNTFKNVQFTFQIGLHKDEIEVLEFIKNTLQCGHISISKDKVNYFIHDKDSLYYVILPIFNYVNLNSSKYHHFVLFEKAVLKTKDKKRYSNEDKLAIINCKEEMQSMTGK